ncbi:MAG: ArnT family glycosyltransferase [Cyclobacteriaceae bacterium]
MLQKDFLADRNFQLGCLVVIGLCSFFINNGFIGPSIMEARNFVTAREILESKDWLVPTMNGYPRLAKPPLPTWITAFVGLVGNLENEVLLRLPAAFISVLMMLFIYKLAKVLSEDDPYIPFLSAAVLGTSLYVVFMGRQGTWDIYCHSFMLGAIWLWAKAWRQEKVPYGLYAWSGILLGCAFLSKGPIPFYALLLPFLISYGWGYGWREMLKQWKGILVSLFICLIISGAWPLYIYLIEPEALAFNVKTEATSWVNRHVRPFWHYSSFPVQSGIWAFLIIAALIVPYAKKRIQSYGNYKFLAGWVILTLILLSIPPEKKERYLLPMLIPIALLVAYYLRYLLQVFKDQAPSKWDTIIVKGNTIFFIFVSIAAPIFFWIRGLATGVSTGYLVLFTAAFLGLGGFMYWHLLKRSLPHIFVSYLIFMCWVSLFFIPLVPHVVYVNQNFRSFKVLRELPEYQELDFYQVDVVRPEEIWDLGKKVDTIRVADRQLQLPSDGAFILFSADTLSSSERFDLPNDLKIEILDVIYYSRRKTGRKSVVSKVTRGQ